MQKADVATPKMTAQVSKLRGFSLFDDYDEDALTEICRCVEVRKFNDGDIVCQEQTPANSMFLIRLYPESPTPYSNNISYL